MRTRVRVPGSLRVQLCEESAVLAEAQVVPPWVHDVEGPLPPRSLDHLSRWFAVDLVRSENAESARPLVYRLDVLDGEVQGLGPWGRRQPALGDVEKSKDRAPAVEVGRG